MPDSRLAGGVCNLQRNDCLGFRARRTCGAITEWNSQLRDRAAEMMVQTADDKLTRSARRLS
jgi:hypothetical protein